MLRWTVPLLLIAGCRQILGIDPAHVADAPAYDAVGDAEIDGIPVDADLSARKKQLEINPTLVGQGLANFPLWVAITDPDIAARARIDGSDIHFRTRDGQLLPYEIQSWDRQTGRLEAWVKVDLSSLLAFDLHYGEGSDPGAEPAPDSMATFSAGFLAAWHFDDSLATPAIVDASGRANASATGLSAANRARGKLGAGIQLSSTTQRIQFANPFTSGTSHTISAWVKLDAAMSYDPLVVVGEPNLNRSRWLHMRYAGSSTGLGFYANDTNTDFIPTEGVWFLVHWVYDNSNRTSRLYINGASVASHVHNMGINTTGSNGYVGWAPEQWGPNLGAQTGMNGTIDEVRLSGTARSALWIDTEYRTQNAPTQSFTVGPEMLP